MKYFTPKKFHEILHHYSWGSFGRVCVMEFGLKQTSLQVTEKAVDRHVSLLRSISGRMIDKSYNLYVMFTSSSRFEDN